MKKVLVRAKQDYEKFPNGVRVRKSWLRNKRFFTAEPEEVDLTPEIYRMLAGKDIEIVDPEEEIN